MKIPVACVTSRTPCGFSTSTHAIHFIVPDSTYILSGSQRLLDPVHRTGCEQASATSQARPAHCRLSAASCLFSTTPTSRYATRAPSQCAHRPAREETRPVSILWRAHAFCSQHNILLRDLRFDVFSPSQHLSTPQRLVAWAFTSVQQKRQNGAHKRHAARTWRRLVWWRDFSWIAR